ncbi:MAG: zinc ribbon domain-containing protein [Chloroflexota bacterium]
MNDERDRRDEDPGQPSETHSDADGSTQEWPVAPEPTDADDSGAEVAATSADASTDPAAEQPAADAAEQPADAAAQGEFEAPPPSAAAWPESDGPREAWPTEPPAAGSGDADTWPTRAPERDDEPAWAAEAPGEAAATPEAGGDVYAPDIHDELVEQHPPSEAEAYAPPADLSRPAADDTAAMAAAATPAHSVPAASEMGESTQCPRCGTENRPGLAFCRNCGQRLVAAGAAATVERPGTPEGTMSCPRCGTHNRAGVAFCQNCGANLRTVATPGYVPPAAGPVAADEPATVVVEDGARAVLGPIVLLIGAAGIVAGWLLPFAYGRGTSLFERAFGTDGYGASFWSAYPDVTGGLADQAYFGFAAPAPLFAALLLVLAIAGMVRARPGMLQGIGLVIALVWAIGLAVLFVVVEVLGNAGGPITELLRALTPGGIIFFLASLIVLIGTLTRFARS